MSLSNKMSNSYVHIVEVAEDDGALGHMVPSHCAIFCGNVGQGVGSCAAQSEALLDAGLQIRQLVSHMAGQKFEFDSDRRTKIPSQPRAFF
jgi:hypothetical protein